MGHNRAESYPANPSNQMSLCLCATFDIALLYTQAHSQKIISVICVNIQFHLSFIILFVEWTHELKNVLRAVLSFLKMLFFLKKIFYRFFILLKLLSNLKRMVFLHNVLQTTLPKSTFP